MNIKEAYETLHLNNERETAKPKKSNKSPFILGILLLYIFLGVGAIIAFLLLRITPPPEVSSIVKDPVQNSIVIGESEEPEPEPEPAEEEPVDPYAGMHFYKLTSSNRTQRLHVRREPGMKGFIIERIKPGTPGYVLYKGLNWSYIAVGDDHMVKGYSFNYYLDLTEIYPEDMPEKLLEESVKLQKAYATDAMPGTEEPGIIGSGGKGILSSWPYENAPGGKFKAPEPLKKDSNEVVEDGTDKLNNSAGAFADMKND